MLILGIETSCDETGIALYDGVENKIIFESCEFVSFVIRAKKGIKIIK